MIVYRPVILLMSNKSFSSWALCAYANQKICAHGAICARLCCFHLITPVAWISSAFYEYISQKASISPTQSVAYHQVAEKYTLKRDDMLAIGEMIYECISRLWRAIHSMIYQVCDLDKKILIPKNEDFLVDHLGLEPRTDRL